MSFAPILHCALKSRAFKGWALCALALALLAGLAGCGVMQPAQALKASVLQTRSSESATRVEISRTTSFAQTPSAASSALTSKRACLVSNVEAQGEFPYQNVPRSLYQWAPDGKSIAYLKDSTKRAADGALRLLHAPTFQSPQPLGSEAQGDIFWSPDQKRVAFLSLRKADELFTIKVIEVASSLETDLFPGATAQTHTGTSPKAVLGWWDNQLLLVTTGCGSGCQHPIKIEIHSLEQVAFEAIDPGVNFVWSPDRNYVTYGLGAMPQLLVARTQHDQIQKIKSFDRFNGLIQNNQLTDLHFTFLQDWTADSSGFLFLRVPSAQQEPATLWGWNVATETGVPLLEGVVQASLAPDGAHLAFVSLGEPHRGRNGEWRGVQHVANGPNPIGFGLYHIATAKAVFHQSIGTVNEGYNGYLPGQDLFRPKWSPQSDRVGFVDANGVALILQLPDLQLFPLDTNSKKVGSMRWSPNGKNIAVSTPKQLLIYALLCKKP